jgi:ATP-dependent Clp protease ATP-binding subunit ClpC
VGKTAIIEGLAKRISEGEVPEVLSEKRILSLDLGLIIAGTIYRGEFEGRLKQITDEVKADPNVILFIDELHNIMGAGSTNGSMDAANLLKPALARGNLRCIGATTIAEYKKHIESDGALERRFQPITVEEPSVEDAIAILKGIRKNYEKFHDVKINDDALDAAVTLSDRYITDRRLPDKAIDLLDEAASRVHVSRYGDAGKKQTARLETELEKMRNRKLDAVHGENFIEALELKREEEKLEDAIKKATVGSAAKTKKKKSAGKITRKEIATVVAQATGIALEELVLEEKTRLLDLENRIKRRIVGQDDAVASVAEMVRRAKAGIADPNRPLASFMFLGPSGVGKTELAKVLTEEVFRDPNAMVRIDMSEFSEGFNMSKLIGAPAGYVGYREETKLTDLVKRRPHSLVLFDEIEKAHPDIHNLLLQLLEDGHVTDATGRKINFKNAIVVMTTNVGADVLRTSGIGFSSGGKDGEPDVKEANDAISGEMEKAFRPEFLNRIDKTVFFRPLSKDDLKSIVTLQFKELSARLSRDHGITLKAGNGAVDLLAEKSWNPLFGARTVRRQIQELVEAPLAKALLSDKYRKGNTVTIAARKDELKFSGTARKASTTTKATKAKTYAGKGGKRGTS